MDHQDLVDMTLCTCIYVTGIAGAGRLDTLVVLTREECKSHELKLNTPGQQPSDI